MGLVAFFLSPIGRYIAIAAIGMALVFGAIWKAERDGERKALRKIEAANNKAENAADAAERCVLAGKWNKETGKCME